jgi:hypothetical protein
MIRFAILLLLLTVWAVPAWSTVYSCRLPDGTIFLTDDRERFPADCEPVGVLELSPPPEPDPTTPPPQVPPDEPLPEPGTEPEPPPQEPWTTPTEPEEPWEDPQEEPLPPGSAGFPPGLQPQQEPEVPVEEPPEPGAPRLEPWMEEAQSLSREYREAQQPPPDTVEEDILTEERLLQIEARIDAFIEELARSGLSPGEQDAVMRELPELE